MSSRLSFKRFSVASACLVLLFCSCEYQDDFDALSAFPANSQNLTLDEIEFTAVEGFDANDLVSKGEAKVSAVGKEIEPGLEAYPLGFSVGNANQFVKLNEISTSFALFNSQKLEEDESAFLWSPFTATGIAVGDIDNDLLPEIFVTHREKGGKLFKNMGGMTFKDVTEDWGISVDAVWGTSPVFVDINQDGWLDLYLCCYNSPNLLFVNNGGKFREEAQRFGLNMINASVGASFADYDRDGDLDLYLVTARLVRDSVLTDVPTEVGTDDVPRVKEELRERYHMIRLKDGNYQAIQSGQYDRLFRNVDGVFEDVTEKSGIGLHPYRGVSAVWSDVNNDGWPDLYVSNNFEDPDQLFLNLKASSRGRVTFEEVSAEAFSQTSLFSKGVDIADLNQDEYADIFVTGTLPDKRLIRANSDGHLFHPNFGEKILGSGEPRQVESNSLQINTHDERFAEIANACGLAATDWSWSTRMEDFDNDGLVDVMLVCGKVRDFLNNDLNQELGAGSEQRRRKFWVTQERMGIKNRIFKNLGQLTFREVTDEWGFGSDETVSQTVATGDLDNDGDLDLVIGGFGEQTQIFRNDLRRRNSIQFALVGVNSPRTGIGSLVKLQVQDDGPIQTRFVNPVRGFFSTNENIVHFGLGDSTRIASLEIHWTDGAVQRFKDLEANFLYRITEPSTLAQEIALRKDVDRGAPLFEHRWTELQSQGTELEYNQFADQKFLPFCQTNLGPCLAWGDVDGDGDRDLFRGGTSFVPGVIYLRDGVELVESDTKTFDDDAESEDLGAAFFDADNDGDLDLYVVSGGVEFPEGALQYNDRLYLNDGAGNFKRSKNLLPDSFASGSCVAPADFDGDGRVDLFVGGRIKPGDYPNSSASRLLKNTEQGFVDVASEYSSTLANTGMVTGGCWADLNNDRLPDLILTNEWGPIRCFVNVEGKRFADESSKFGLANRNGWFSSICTGDIDNDGDTDLFVGNLGTNSRYQATQDRPIRLFSAYINGAQRLFEAETENGLWYPSRSLELVKRFIPDVAAPYRTFAGFAQEPMTQVLNESIAGKITSHSINELRSGFLVNRGGETVGFDFVPLPVFGQASPVFGCQLVDVNGDGNLDLYLLQNETDLFEHTHPMNNGRSILLTGDGQGGFTSRLKVDSGLEVVGDGAALTCVDLNQDQRVDFFAATNDRGTSVFLNRGQHKPFALDIERLKKSYIGAKVRLKFYDGSKQLHEVFATSGYLSQSAPVIYSNAERISEIEISWPDGTSESGTVEEFQRRQ